MYAIVQQGGHQYRVSPGDRLVVDRLDADVGSVVALEPVLLLEGEAGDLSVGSPVVDGARVAAVVVGHALGRKIRVFKYKPKKHYRRTLGHRSRLTELRVEALLAAGDPLPVAADREPEPEATPPQAEAAAEVEAVETPAPRRRRSPVKRTSAAAPETAGTDDAPSTED